MTYKIVKYPTIKWFFCLGLFCLPLVFWPWAEIPYEIPKVWFFNRWAEALGVLGFLRILGDKGNRENKENKGNFFLILAVGGFVLVSIISSVFGADFNKSVWGNYYRGDGLLTLLHLAGLFYFLAFFWEKSWEKPTALAIAGGGLVVSFWTVLVGVLGRLGVLGVTGGSMFGEAVGGTFGNPNFLAGYLLISLPFTIYSVKNFGKLGPPSLKLRRVKILGILAQMGAIGFTSSRAGVVGILLLGVGYYWGRLRKLGRLGVLGVLGILLGLGIFREYKLLTENFAPESRQRIIVRGVNGFFKRPILGWGVANFDYAFESNYWPMKYERDVYVDKGHSNLLEVLTTTGLVGFVLYSGIIFRTIGGIGPASTSPRRGREIRGDKGWKKTLLLTFLLFLFHSQTNVISINEEMIFWLIAGIAFAS